MLERALLAVALALPIIAGLELISEAAQNLRCDIERCERGLIEVDPVSIEGSRS